MNILCEMPEDKYRSILELSSVNLKNRNKGAVMNALNAIAFGTPIHNDATNGDVIRIMFPEAYIIMPEEDLPSAYLKVKVIHSSVDFNYYNLDWWNRKYKGE